MKWLINISRIAFTTGIMLATLAVVRALQKQALSIYLPDFVFGYLALALVAYLAYLVMKIFSRS